MEAGPDRDPSGQKLLAEAARFVEQGWSQFGDARSTSGSLVKPWSDEAVSWSLLGALIATVERRAASNGEAVTLIDLAAACSLLGDVIDSDSLDAWNDKPGRRQADVIGALMAASEVDHGGLAHPSNGNVTRPA